MPLYDIKISSLLGDERDRKNYLRDYSSIKIKWAVYSTIK